MNINNIKIFFYIAFFLGIFASPYFVGAQSLSVVGDKSVYRVGEDISVVLRLNTSGKSINVVDGTIGFPKELFDVKSVKFDNSFLKLWVKMPTVSSDGTISFSGGVPHGFNGLSGNVLSFILKPKKVGQAVVSVKNATLFLNDGLGTKLTDTTFSPLNVTINNTIKNQLAISKN